MKDEIKEKDLKFIKAFAKISVSKICEKINLKRNNLYTGKASAEQIHKMREQIEKEFSKLYITE